MTFFSVIQKKRVFTLLFIILLMWMGMQGCQTLALYIFIQQLFYI